MTPKTANPTPLSNNDSRDLDWHRALSQHEDALRELVRAKMSGKGESAIDDVLQEVAIAAHKAAPGTVTPEKVGSWLKQVAANKVKDHWRRIERKDRLHDGINQNETLLRQDQKSPFEWVLSLEQTELVGKALDQLSPVERTTLEKMYLEGKSCREIAQEENVKEKAIEYRLSKARQSMRAILQPDFKTTG